MASKESIFMVEVDLKEEERSLPAHCFALESVHGMHLVSGERA